MRLASHLQLMPADRPPSSREILLALIDTGDIVVGQGGEVIITFAPDAETLDALMCFDAIEREDEQVLDGYQGRHYGDGGAA